MPDIAAPQELIRNFVDVYFAAEDWALREDWEATGGRIDFGYDFEEFCSEYAVPDPSAPRQGDRLVNTFLATLTLALDQARLTVAPLFAARRVAQAELEQAHQGISVEDVNDAQTAYEQACVELREAFEVELQRNLNLLHPDVWPLRHH